MCASTKKDRASGNRQRQRQIEISERDNAPAKIRSTGAVRLEIRSDIQSMRFSPFRKGEEKSAPPRGENKKVREKGKERVREMPMDEKKGERGERAKKDRWETIKMERERERGKVSDQCSSVKIF